MKLDIGYQTDPGPRKGVNQDSLMVVQSDQHPDIVLLVVADGMGGAKAGDKASQEAVKVIKKHLFSNPLPTPDTAMEQLNEAIIAANNSIFDRAQSSPDMEGMGCTVVAVLALGDLYWVASVGDSRVYLIRNNEPHQLTEDHTWVNARVREGVLTPEQAENHQLRHVLDRALGTRPTVEVDVRHDEILEEGDTLVLCTDGLYGVLDDDQITQTATGSGAEDAAKRLLERALAAPAHDNVTVVVMQVQSL